MTGSPTDKWGQSTIDHIGWYTPDLEASVTFWTQVMGFEATPVQERYMPWIGQLIGLPGAKLRLVHLFGHGGHIEFIQIQQASAPTEALSHLSHGAHICLRVKDIVCISEAIVTGGGSLQGQLTPIGEGKAAGLKGIYARDPHGVLIELIELCRTGDGSQD